MKFKSVNIKNFMSFGEVFFDLSPLGLHLVLGVNKDAEQFDSNGSGKSGIFDAIIWALYGSILRDVSIDDLVRKGETECTVAVTVDTGEEDITITRSRVLNKKSTLVVASQTEEDLFPSNSVTDKQQHINTLLGLDFKTFTNSVYFGKGLSQFFMVADDETRKDILEAILQLVDFDSVHSKIKLKHKDINEKFLNTQQKLTIAVRDIDLKRQSYDRHYRSYEEQQVEVQPKIDKLTTELVDLDKSSSAYGTKILGIDNKIKAADEKYTKIETAIEKEIAFENDIVSNNCKVKVDKLEQAYKNDISSLTSKYDKLIDSLKTEEEILIQRGNALHLSGNSLFGEKISCQSKIEDINKKKITLENLSTGAVCDTCSSVITEEHRYEVLSSLDNSVKELTVISNDILRRIDNYLTENKLNKENIAAIAKTVNEASTKFSNDKLSKLSLKQDAIRAVEESKFSSFAANKERYAGRLSQEFTAYTNLTNELKEERARLKTEKSQLVSRKELLVTTISTLENGLKQTVKLLQDLDKEIKDLEEDSKEYKKLVSSYKKEIDCLSFWVEAFSQKGIRSFIFEASLPELSSRANYYSNVLTGGTISINILPTTMVKSTGNSKERLNIIVNNSLGATSYDGCSEGEKRRVDLCLLLALQDLVSSRGTKKWETAFFDEVFDTLDNTGISSVIDLLKTEFSNKSIYLISHNNDLKNFFDSAIIIKKEHGISTVER